MKKVNLSGQEVVEVGGDSWATPDDLFRGLDYEFAFTLDAAANSANTKLPSFCEDGLKASWAGQRVWCNPPYSDIRPWVEKAARREADVAALLLPVRTGTDWFLLYGRHADEIRYFRRRVSFVGAKDTPSWETALFVWWGGAMQGGAKDD
jgi:phage N-6-adenine-methyltransferase